MKDLIGKTLGGYQIVEQIGKGGMATVYKAYQPSLDRDVAVKVLPPFYAEQDESFITRFKREARSIAKLRHPNILMVMDFGEKDDISYIIMEYVDAGTMKDRLTTPVALSEIYMFIKQIASALDYAHSEGVIHRDIKPSNILMPKPDWVLLTDFGLAKMVGGSMLTQSGMTVGTPAYMSPEQGGGNKIDARTDIYALGVMLYELVVGEVPYIAETPMAVIVKHIVDPLPMPRAKNPDIPEELQRVILKALAKDPEDRFQKAGEITEAMKPIVKANPDWSASEIQAVTAIRTKIEDRPSTKMMAEETAEAVPPTLSTPQTVGADTTEPAEATTQQAATKAVDPPKKKPRWLIIAGVVVVGIILAAMFQDPIRRMLSGGDNSANTAVDSGDDDGFAPGDDEFEFDSPEDAFGQGKRALEQGNFERAKRIFKIALDKNPDFYWELIDIADGIYYNGNVKLAIRVLEEIAFPSLEGPDIGANEWVGWMYMDIGQPRRAQEYFILVLENDPNFAGAYWGLIEASYQTGEEWDAIVFLELLKEDHPEIYFIWYMLGELYSVVDEQLNAVDNYQVAMELNSDDPLLFIKVAEAYSAMGNENEALDLIEKALDLDPDDANLWDNAGSIYYDLGWYDEAVVVFEWAIELDPNYDWPYIGLLETLVLLGNRDDEIRELIETAEPIIMNVMDPAALDSLGWIYSDIGDCDNGIRIFNMVLEIDPGFESAREGLEECGG